MALDFIKKEMTDNDDKPDFNGFGSDVPNELCYKWAEEYFKNRRNLLYFLDNIEPFLRLVFQFQINLYRNMPNEYHKDNSRSVNINK